MLNKKAVYGTNLMAVELKNLVKMNFLDEELRLFKK